MIALEKEQAEQVARLVWKATMGAWQLCLGGPTWPAKEAEYARMKDPQPGDMVVEHSAGLRQLDVSHSVGCLLKITREPVDWGDPEFVWDEKVEGRPAPTERIYYIAALDGTEVRWTNATFIGVPNSEGWWDIPRWQEALAKRQMEPQDDC